MKQVGNFFVHSLGVVKSQTPVQRQCKQFGQRLSNCFILRTRLGLCLKIHRPYFYSQWGQFAYVHANVMIYLHCKLIELILQSQATTKSCQIPFPFQITRIEPVELNGWLKPSTRDTVALSCRASSQHDVMPCQSYTSRTICFTGIKCVYIYQ